MNRVIVFDTETTGLLLPSITDIEKQPRIIEIGLVTIDDGAITNKYSQLINPGMKLPELITKITGLTDDDLVSQPSFNAVLPQLIDYFISANKMVAHNAPFDREMLANELKRCGAYETFPWPKKIICTAQEFEYIKGRRMRMQELYQYTFGRPLNQTHRALDDAMALAEIVIETNAHSGILSDDSIKVEN